MQSRPGAPTTASERPGTTRAGMREDVGGHTGGVSPFAVEALAEGLRVIPRGDPLADGVEGFACMLDEGLLRAVR